jgi:hypothetical protein
MSQIWGLIKATPHLYPYVRVLLVLDFRLLYRAAHLLYLPGSPEGRGAHQPQFAEEPAFLPRAFFSLTGSHRRRG